MKSLTPIEKTYWDAFTKTHPLAKGATVSSAMPGNAQIADSLVALYLAGKKTAGSGLVKDYEVRGEPLPAVGDYWVVLDAKSQPRCIAETIRVEVHPFEEVTEEIARAEAEGDLTLNAWREIHAEFFKPFLPKLGIGDLNRELIVTEFYRVYR